MFFELLVVTVLSVSHLVASIRVPEKDYVLIIIANLESGQNSGTRADYETPTVRSLVSSIFHQFQFLSWVAAAPDVTNSLHYHEKKKKNKRLSNLEHFSFQDVTHKLDFEKVCIIPCNVNSY